MPALSLAGALIACAPAPAPEASREPLTAVSRGVLEASDAAAGDRYGVSIAVDGSFAVIGARSREQRTGAAYVLERTSAGWIERAALVPPDAMRGDDAGAAVAISGDTIAIGSPGVRASFARAGAVDLFRLGPSGWAHEQRIVNPSPTTSNEVFGDAVALAGDLLVVGAPGDRAVASGAGGAYTYVRSGATWSAESQLTWSTASSNDAFGSSVATDGTRIVVGAPSDNVITADAAFLRAGAVFVHARDGAGVWVEEARLVAAEPDVDAELGRSVALSGDRVIAGAPGADDDGPDLTLQRGYAHVFVAGPSGWSEDARLRPSRASDWGFRASFGRAVDIAGPIAVIGAPGLPAAFLFERDEAGWIERTDRRGRAGTGELGLATALDGTSWLVGAPGEDLSGGRDHGAVYAYELTEPLSLGAACAADEQCETGFCADGVCCESACAGPPGDCLACSIAAGAAVDGVCAAVAAGRICRGAAGACDVEERCDGASSECPGDERAPAGTVCRVARGPCDVEETCAEDALTCPADVAASDGTACDDDAICSGAGVCSSGECVASGGSLDCDDGDVCTADACGPGGECRHTPIEGCCAADDACDDADPCTLDRCDDARCAHAPVDGCGLDGGAPDGGAVDGGVLDGGASDGDAGAPDASSGEPEIHGGCSCSAPGPGRDPSWWLVALAALLLARSRRVCARARRAHLSAGSDHPPATRSA